MTTRTVDNIGGWQPPRGDWAYRMSQRIVWATLAGFTRRRLHGFENVTRFTRKREAFLLASNHISHFDGPLLTMTVPRPLDWLTAAAFFTPPALGAWMRKSGGVPVRHTGGPVIAAVREARRRLARGRALGIFPEGGIRDGAASILEGAPPRRGVMWLAVRELVPVVPCVILGSDRLYDGRYWRPWSRPGRVPVWMGFGPAILPGEWENGAPDLLGERIRALYAEMRAVFHLKSEDLPMDAQRRRAHF